MRRAPMRTQLSTLHDDNSFFTAMLLHIPADLEASLGLWDSVLLIVCPPNIGWNTGLSSESSTKLNKSGSECSGHHLNFQ